MAISLLGIRSRKTVSGLNRIAQILAPDITIDTTGEGNEKDYDGIFAHNHFGDPFSGRLPRILYLASRRTAWLTKNAKNMKYVTENMPTALWVNQNTGRKMLKRIGIEARTMYRPNRLTIPDSCPPLPNEKKILWHWMPGEKWMPPELENEITDAMRELSDVKIRIINSDRKGCDLKPKGGGLEHVEAGGFLDLQTEMQHWHGIVRIYNVPKYLDYGRSTFQAFAHGRWYIYRMVREPFVTTVKNVKSVVSVVRQLLDNFDTKTATEMWQYAKNEFSEEVLHDRWVKAVKEIIC